MFLKGDTLETYVKNKKNNCMNYKLFVRTMMSILFLIPLISCKTDNSRKKDADYVFWNASQKTENSYIKEAVKGIHEVKGESLVISRYTSTLTNNDVIEFFTRYTKDREISEAILNYAVKYDVPPTLAFSLAFTESSYDPKAINQNSRSVDRGLFQLNSKSFSYLSVDDFYNVEINAKKGIEYIRWCLDVGKNEVSALAMYNAGLGRVSGGGTPRMTLNYIDKVLNYRDQLLDEFNSEMSTYAGINPVGVKLVKDLSKPLDRP